MYREHDPISKEAFKDSADRMEAIYNGNPFGLMTLCWYHGSAEDANVPLPYPPSLGFADTWKDSSTRIPVTTAN